MRLARTCYDHIAGRLGVAIADRLIEKGAIEFDDDSGRVTAAGTGVLSLWGLDLGHASAVPIRSTRTHCRPCLDWSERRLHVAGRLGAQLCLHCLDQGWLLKSGGSRALAVTPKGVVRFQSLLGRSAWDRVVDRARP
jgi:hypothetical protein